MNDLDDLERRHGSSLSCIPFTHGCLGGLLTLVVMSDEQYELMKDDGVMETYGFSDSRVR